MNDGSRASANPYADSICGHTEYHLAAHSGARRRLSRGRHTPDRVEGGLRDQYLAFQFLPATNRAVARRWPDVFSNAVEPGWVATKMGGAGASDDLDQGHRTQVWLAVSDDPAAKVTSEYFYHMSRRAPNPATRDIERQEKLIEACERFSGVKLPGVPST